MKYICNWKIDEEMIKENRIKWRRLRRGRLGRVCYCCETYITMQNFGGSNRWHYKRKGQGTTIVLCPYCSRKIGLAMPIWCDSFRSD